MRAKYFTFIVLALALTLSACGGGPTTINQAAAPQIRTLNVNGSGQVSLTPDMGYIYIGVHDEAATASEAVEANKTHTTAVIAAIKEAGVDEKDINTSNFSIWPSQQYSPEGTITGTVYMVDNTVYVIVRDINTLGDLLDASITAGANTINSIQFDIADKKDAVKEARAKAVADAQTQAQELAEAAGLTLGDIQSISFYDNSAIPYYEGKGGGGGMDMANSAVPIQPGQLNISVSVNIVYEIK